jgi:ATP-binding cassette subfamily B protein
MIKNILQLLNSVKKERKREIILIIVLMLLSSILEVISIGAVLPFLSALNDPNKIQELKYANLLEGSLKIGGANTMLLILTLCFGTIAIISAVVKLLLLRVSLKFSNKVGADLGLSILNVVLYQP